MEHNNISLEAVSFGVKKQGLSRRVIYLMIDGTWQLQQNLLGYISQKITTSKYQLKYGATDADSIQRGY